MGYRGRGNTPNPLSRLPMAGLPEPERMGDEADVEVGVTEGNRWRVVCCICMGE